MNFVTSDASLSFLLKSFDPFSYIVNCCHNGGQPMSYWFEDYIDARVLSEEIFLGL